MSLASYSLRHMNFIMWFLLKDLERLFNFSTQNNIKCKFDK